MAAELQKIPFLRPVLALAAGIIFGTIAPDKPVMFISLFILLFIFLFLLNRKYSIKRNTVFGIGLQLLLIITGITVYLLHNRKPDSYDQGKFYAEVHEILQDKPKSLQTVLKIKSVSNNDSVFVSKEKVMAYFVKSSKSEELIPGDVIVFEQKPVFIKSSNNPYEFDYSKYLGRKGIYRQVYLADNKWVKAGYKSEFSLSVTAEKVRLKLMNIYRAHNMTGKEYDVLSALTLGYSRGLDPETKRVFSSAGAMHVLAVSGLHVGIIFMAVKFLFGFLKKRRAGRFIYLFFALVSLWSFAFITGLAPSVKRAATMFSFFVIGESIKRQQNTYNSMAASAFLLLLINPNNLFEAGFQLSYSAVFGIVFLQPRLVAIFNAKNKIVLFIRDLLTVSVAAQIATFPISIYYFSQFPTFFWLSNLLVIPAATILIPLGFSLLFLHWIPVVAKYVSVLIELFITQLINFLGFVEKLPASVINISISETELFILVVAVVLASFFIATKRVKYFKGAVISFLLLALVITAENINRIFNREIIVYNHSGPPLLHFIHGKRNYAVLPEKMEATDFALNSVENVSKKLRLKKPFVISCNKLFSDDYIFVDNGLIVFDDKIIFNGFADYQRDEKIAATHVIDPSPKNISEILNKPDVFIISSARYSYQESDAANKIYYLNENGAFRQKWQYNFD